MPVIMHIWISKYDVFLNFSRPHIWFSLQVLLEFLSGQVLLSYNSTPRYYVLTDWADDLELWINLLAWHPQWERLIQIYVPANLSFSTISRELSLNLSWDNSLYLKIICAWIKVTGCLARFLWWFLNLLPRT